MDSESPAFLALILEWIKANEDESAVAVTDVSGYGTDWAGGTEEGFYETFSVSLSWRNAVGRRSVDVQGSQMQSLWRHVVGGVG